MASPTEFHEGRPASLVLSSARRPVRPRLWLWPNLLSLDAPVVAVLWQALFILCFHATVKTLPMVILFCAVWMIYSADRVLDVWRGAGSRPRHEFCRRHWIAASPAFFGVLALTVWMTLAFLPHVFFIRGVCLGSAVIVYFGAVHLLPKRFRGLWPKEAAVAVVFALGISLVIWSSVRTAADVLAIALFACLCWINCLAIEQWEGDGWKKARGLRAYIGGHIGAAAACVAIVAILALVWQRPVLAAAEAASALAFTRLDRIRLRLSPDALRVLADAALLSPILFLPFIGIRL